MNSVSLLRIVLMTAVLALARTGLAQEDTWTTGGPYDASVYAITIDPTDNMHIYIGTLEDFVYQTTNGGAEWSTVSIDDSPDVFVRSMVRSINIHPLAPDTMFMATYKGAYKSIDAGQTWYQMFPQWPQQMWSVSEISHADPPVLFLGTVGSAWRSANNGGSWTQMPFLIGDVVEIKADPMRPDIIYAVNNTTVPNAQIWKSTNAGLFWTNIENNIQYDSPEAYGRFLEIDPVDPDIIYFSRHSHVYEEALLKSTNGGEEWTDITPTCLDSLHDGFYLHQIAVSPLDHNTVLVCSDKNGVLRSTDGGATWHEANQGIIAAQPTAKSLTADPTTGFIYLGWYCGGIYRSTDNGQSWQKISYNITASQVLDIALNRRHPDTLFAGTGNGLYISTDGAASWEYVEFSIPDPFAAVAYGVLVDPYDPSYVYVGAYGAMYRSTDGGAAWETISQSLPPDISYEHMAVADLGGGVRRLFAGAEVGLFLSDDLGENWARCENGIPPDISVADVAVSTVNPFIVFAGDSYGGLYVSEDEGESWELTDSPNEIKEIACDPMDAAIVYITTDNGRIEKSTDCGWSWMEIDQDIPHDNNRLFTGLAINPLNHENIFVWSSKKGIFQSHDGGEHWDDFNMGLGPGSSMAGHPLACTLIDPVDTGRVFIGVWGGSVWTVDRTTTSIDLVDNALPETFLASSYPNPFNPSATIKYSLPERAFVTVEIYDLLGRRVDTLVDQVQQAGRYRAVWDAREQASGLYYYKITAGQRSKTGVMTLLK